MVPATQALTWLTAICRPPWMSRGRRPHLSTSTRPTKVHRTLVAPITTALSRAEEESPSESNMMGA